MDLPVIYLVIFVAYIFWMFSVYIRNFATTMLACLLMFGISVYTFKNGISVFSYNNFLVIIFSAVTFGIAAYTSLKVAIDLMK